MYQPGIVFKRTPEERADIFLAWKRDDKAFFAAGACHILAFLFQHIPRGLPRGDTSGRESEGNLWFPSDITIYEVKPIPRGLCHGVVHLRSFILRLIIA
jgi:hypothetical protein